MKFRDRRVAELNKMTFPFFAFGERKLICFLCSNFVDTYWFCKLLSKMINKGLFRLNLSQSKLVRPRDWIEFMKFQLIT